MTFLLMPSAFLLDLLFGDPQWFPHPVRLVGKLASSTEELFRGMSFLPLRMAGALTAATVIMATVVTVLALVVAAFLLHPFAGVVVSVLLLYFAIAPRDLYDHASAVRDALRAGDLELARRKVAMMVGRDTSSLDDEGVARAAVESVAENTSDGVTAPLFYGILFGPAGAWLYKASNTLDSMFGYRNERYREFGWASARFDDLLNYLPARLTVLAVAGAAFILRLDPAASIRSVRLCAKKHESPNAGYPESAFAGALGVTLGGERSYGGVTKTVPTLGIRSGAMDAATITRAMRLMYVTASIFLAAGSVILFITEQFTTP
ncbi:adenosylcobinamide-phosphate synthase CbiB [Chlorobaculum sp. MV4-Y]|uniref:adenosylcobinamide-phosphate synthase CbiB n=1 Tax=Chlorobaculum sp. MV4-Y TaxID=2976335 RepID=UPI0021AEEEAB|nr:adenosylcobinamide-phosphate synthase CbiB [Chlorobaculum sp. MV4-Y]UWX58408.1 adenosylcobinamide-phosphate synthase CbiB [Chlorobaculum sp. MV4-Y]